MSIPAPARAPAIRRLIDRPLPSVVCVRAGGQWGVSEDRSMREMRSPSARSCIAPPAGASRSRATICAGTGPNSALRRATRLRNERARPCVISRKYLNDGSPVRLCDSTHDRSARRDERCDERRGPGDTTVPVVARTPVGKDGRMRALALADRPFHADAGVLARQHELDAVICLGDLQTAWLETLDRVALP